MIKKIRAYGCTHCDYITKYKSEAEEHSLLPTPGTPLPNYTVLKLLHNKGFWVVTDVRVRKDHRHTYKVYEFTDYRGFRDYRFSPNLSGLGSHTRRPTDKEFKEFMKLDHSRIPGNPKFRRVSQERLEDLVAKDLARWRPLLVERSALSRPARSRPPSRK